VRASRHARSTRTDRDIPAHERHWLEVTQGQDATAQDAEQELVHDHGLDGAAFPFLL
jgi:hypothetical protein